MVILVPVSTDAGTALVLFCLILSAVLRWMNYKTNDDPLDWLSEEKLEHFVKLFMEKWKLVHEESDSKNARGHGTIRCLPGASIEIMIQ